MARVIYGPIDRDRIRVIRDGFGWVDHRFVRGRYIDGCSPQALALYLFRKRHKLTSCGISASCLYWFHHDNPTRRFAMDSKSQQAQTRDEVRREWREIINEWKRSGESKAAFCREWGIAIWQFHYWCGRFKGDGQSESSNADPVETPAFTQLIPAEPERSVLSLYVGSLRIEVGREFDEITLRRVIEIVGTC